MGLHDEIHHQIAREIRQEPQPEPAATGPERPSLPVAIRPASSTDLAALEAFLDRCSEESRSRRFHGATGTYARRELIRISAGTPLHRSRVAVHGDDIVGTATLAWGSDGEVEVAFLVEDAWTRRGIGRMLVASLLDDAAEAGLTSVLARVQGDNETARRFLRAVAPAGHTRFAGAGELELVLPVGPAKSVELVKPLEPIAVGASADDRGPAPVAAGTPQPSLLRRSA